MPTPRPPTDPEAFLAEFTPDLAALASRLRARILDRHPALEERVYPGWGGLGYHVRGAGYVGAIFPRDGYLDVGFEHGAELADPSGLFYRGGKQLRYARLDSWDEPRVAAILDLLDAAITWQGR